MIQKRIRIAQLLHLGMIQGTDVYALFIWIISKADSGCYDSIAVGVGVDCGVCAE
jgi:hypothetical protein